MVVKICLLQALQKKRTAERQGKTKYLHSPSFFFSLGLPLDMFGFQQKDCKLPPALFEFPQLLMSNLGSCFLLWQAAPNSTFHLSFFFSPFSPHFSVSHPFFFFFFCVCQLLCLLLLLRFPASSWKLYSIYRLSFLIPVQTTIANDFLTRRSVGGRKEEKKEGGES